MLLQRRVLLVEDNADTRETLATLLRLWDFEVQSTEDAKSGVRKAHEWKPDVAIVDIGLPGVDGYEVARRVRTDLGANIRLVALTAHCGVSERQRGFEAGFDDYLVKPAPLDELVRSLSRVAVSHPKEHPT